MFWKKKEKKNWQNHENPIEFSFGGWWGQPMSLFWKLVDETQMAAPLEYTDAFIIIKKLFLGGLQGLQSKSKLRKTLWNRFTYNCQKNFLLHFWGMTPKWYGTQVMSAEKGFLLLGSIKYFDTEWT